jgi:hypothetical protein
MLFLMFLKQNDWHFNSIHALFAVLMLNIGLIKTKTLPQKQVKKKKKRAASKSIENSHSKIKRKVIVEFSQFLSATSQLSFSAYQAPPRTDVALSACPRGL